MRANLETLRKQVENRLEQLLTRKEPELLWLSMAYSVQAGGKRLRPILNLLAADLLGEDHEPSLDNACAIEMIHTYSLIHDDLPAMDNDDLRRGKPTNHVIYGEAQAILAGDGLLNYAFEVMLDNALKHPANLEAHIQAMSLIARAAGVRGMIAGQTADVALEGQKLSGSELTYIHKHKTAAMIEGALLSGLALYHPTKEQEAALGLYGYNLGLVFQIVDDVLDITAGAELGKTRGKDAAAGKTTFPTLYGIDGSMKIAKEKTEEAKDALHIFGEKAEELIHLADDLLIRIK